MGSIEPAPRPNLPASDPPSVNLVTIPAVAPRTVVEPIVRWHCLAMGQVQGVNYRARVAEAARRHEVVGTVENRADGTVFIDVQGPRHRVEAFLHEIRGARGASRPSSVERIADAPVASDRRGFEILRS